MAGQKKIALFSDGTGNSPSNPQKTNVWRAYQAVDRSPDSGQCAFYDNGVGTSRFTPTAVLGLAFGWGLARNVRDLYGYLVHVYERGDDIYCFGFSRGAYTIRVLVGLICSQGIINREEARDEKDLDRLIKAAYRRYRREEFAPSLLSHPYRIWQKWVTPVVDRLKGRRPYDPTRNIGHGGYEDALIEFVGVWDTVGAYGGPVEELTRAWDRVIWPLTARDRDLSGRVRRACHALALDEQRESFTALLWNEASATPRSHVDDERITQVWFPGVHSNVGGSYPDDALALVALDWLLCRSEKQGLRFVNAERERLRDAADVTGRLYDSRAGIANLYRYAPRRLERLGSARQPGLADWLKEKARLSGVNENRVDIAKPKIHHSVFDRLANSGDAYAPINIPADYAVVDPGGRVRDIREAGPRDDGTETEPYELPENSAQASRRTDRQTLVWNKVWFLRLLHFVTLATIAVFIVYPYFAVVEPGDDPGPIMRFVESLFGTFGLAIRAIPELVGSIPGLGFAQGWSERYEPFPFVFMFFVLAIIAMFALAWRINASLKSEMRLLWRHVSGTGAGPGATDSEFRRRLAGFLNGDLYRNRIAWSVRVGLETIAVLFFLLVLLAAASRLVFVAVDGFGGVCEPAQDERKLGETFEFDPRQGCFATGIELKAGRTYEIEIDVSEWWDGEKDGGAGDWIDADVDGWRTDAGVEGVATASWYTAAGVPFRRHLLVDWYVIVARVNDALFDRHPLIRDTDTGGAAAREPKKPKEGITHLRTTFTARRDGQLYLYMNDMVVFTPGFLIEFYSNNHGSAEVVVKPEQAP